MWRMGDSRLLCQGEDYKLYRNWWWMMGLTSGINPEGIQLMLTQYESHTTVRVHTFSFVMRNMILSILIRGWLSPPSAFIGLNDVIICAT